MPKGHLNNGRSKGGERYVKVPVSIQRSLAWKRLTCNARAAWVEIGFFYNGYNNGSIGISVRRLGDEMGISKNTAANAILELIKWGFLDQVKASSFSQKRLCAEYRLTHLHCNKTGQPASHRYKRIEALVRPAEERAASPIEGTR
jgi:hypothetical protein